MIYHVYSKLEPKDPETKRRHHVAYQTWQQQPWDELPIWDEDLPRLFTEHDRRIPFVRDLFNRGSANAQPEDIVIYTNVDIMVRGDCCARVAETLQNVDACYAYRRDFQHRIEKPLPDGDYAKGLNYAGSDLFAFRAGWWEHVKEAMPDMLIATEAWDPVLRTLIDETNPQGGTCVPDIICHERHYSRWEDPKFRYKSPAQVHNLGQARMFFALRAIDWRKFGIP